jgi:hypothetical protein
MTIANSQFPTPNGGGQRNSLIHKDLRQNDTASVLAEYTTHSLPPTQSSSAHPQPYANSNCPSPQYRPIVFVHRGCPDYLKITLTKARQYNPDSPLILLGDSSNAHLVQEVAGLEFKPIRCDAGDCARFAKVYEHQSHLAEEFERFCIQRWILLRDLMSQNNWNRLLYLDSDVLLYSDVEQSGKRFDDSALSLARWLGGSAWCGHTCFINHSDVLGEFVDLLFELYTTAEGKRLREKYITEKLCWISDMTCFYFFRQRTSRPIANLTDVIDNAVFDDRISDTHGIYEKASRLLKKDMKSVFFKDSIPYCRLKESGENIRFFSFHFHGGMKYMIKYFAAEHKDRIANFAMFRERVICLIRRLYKEGKL